MPRLGQNPELLRAARLARVGPETWESWKKAGSVPLEILKSLMADSPAGDILRSLGVEMPKKRADKELLKDYVLDFGMPNVPVGQIKRLSHALRKGEPSAKKVRQVMKEEMQRRGPAEAEDYTDTLLRSTPFHGRGYEHYPQTGEVYNPGIPKPGNIGEPQGLSLTYREPRKFVSEHSSFAKSPKKYNQAIYKLEAAQKQAIPSLKDPLVLEAKKITDQLIHQRELLAKEFPPSPKDTEKWTKGWIKKLRELDNKIDQAKDNESFAYKQTVKYKLGNKIRGLEDKGTIPPISRVFPRFHGRPTEKVIKGWRGGGDEEILQEGYKYALQQMPEMWKKDASGILALPPYHVIKNNMTGPMRQTFNTHLTDYLRSQGYRGVLYSPQRYGEYELRMLDPRDVVQQDIRQVDDPALRRMYEGKIVPTGEIVRSPIQGKDLTVLEEVKPSKVKAINEWKHKSDLQANPSGSFSHQPYALGAIYKDIDLGGMELLPDHIRKAAAQDVKTRLLAEEVPTLEAGLDVGKLGDIRIRKDDIPKFGDDTQAQIDELLSETKYNEFSDELDAIPLKIKTKKKKKISLGSDN